MENNDIKLYTKRLLLRKVKPSDESFLFSLYNNELVNSSYICTSLRDRQVLNEWLNNKVNLIKYIWIIEFNNNAVGIMNAFESQDASDCIEIGYAIDPLHWNKGYCSEALTCVIDYLLNKNYHKVLCSHFLFNEASGRVMQKANMFYEGIRFHDIKFNGKYHSLAYYYATKETVKLIYFLKIASELNDNYITYGIGSSCMLYFKDIVDHFNDIDLVVIGEDYKKTNEIIKKYLNEKEVKNDDQYTTKIFKQYTSDILDIDLMVNMTIGDITYNFDENAIDEYVVVNNIELPFCKISDWYKLYQAMGRKEKVKLIKDYLGEKHE